MWRELYNRIDAREIKRVTKCRAETLRIFYLPLSFPLVRQQASRSISIPSPFLSRESRRLVVVFSRRSLALPRDDTLDVPETIVLYY